MSDAQARRMGAATGIIFVALIVIGLFAVVPKGPAFNSSAASIQQFYVHNRHDLQVGLFIASFGFLFFVWFLGSLVSHLRRFEGQEGRLTSISGALNRPYFPSAPRSPAGRVRRA
ncbi:MAG: hypothetical protein WB507_07760 [Solirubrobacterales bacterium]